MGGTGGLVGLRVGLFVAEPDRFRRSKGGNGMADRELTDVDVLWDIFGFLTGGGWSREADSLRWWL